MKSKKGFTLIELLAIIVILAIIAVITVPIILNIIDNSRMGAATDSAYGYKDAINKWYVTKLSQDKNFELEDKVYNVTELETAGLTVSGNRPDSSSWVKIVNNKTVKGCLQFDEYKVKITNEQVETPVKGTCAISGDFANDSWETIQENIEIDRTVYAVGSRKQIEMDIDEDGINETYWIRIANTSIDGCENKLSKSACGVVIEFEDIIATHRYNATNTTKGGWPGSEMYQFLNDNNENDILSIYEKLPSDLKSIIIDTPTVSNHSIETIEDYYSIDKLYLLTYSELSGTFDSLDTASKQTRGLDFYKGKGANSFGKKKNGTSTYGVVALRQIDKSPLYGVSDKQFGIVMSNGMGSMDANGDTFGVSPLFRIGE